mmetsp:Transcript_315/g.704  ORF Transcript_315/g.704 Transcript_315/m.704 type:complete len:207 (-) Transcript_315:62-682(-)
MDHEDGREDPKAAPPHRIHQATRRVVLEFVLSREELPRHVQGQALLQRRLVLHLGRQHKKRLHASRQHPPCPHAAHPAPALTPRCWTLGVCIIIRLGDGVHKLAPEVLLEKRLGRGVRRLHFLEELHPEFEHVLLLAQLNRCSIVVSEGSAEGHGVILPLLTQLEKPEEHLQLEEQGLFTPPLTLLEGVDLKEGAAEVLGMKELLQ